MFDYVIQSVSYYLNQWFHMYPIFIMFIVGCIIQFTKVIIDSIIYKRFYRWHILSSGGFPSFHSGLSSSVIMLAVLEYGFDSSIFAIACAFWILFAYDAMNLRYEAGQHAHYINDLRYELQNVISSKKVKWPLKERIWHTPLEVLGWIIFGCILTYVLYYIIYIA